MNILFDFITLQDKFINGGAGYTWTILNSLIDKENLRIYGLYDNNKEIPNTLEKFINKYRIETVSINDDINLFINEKQIKKLFIGVAQRYNSFKLDSLKCELIIACLDVGSLTQLYDNNIESVTWNNFEKHYLLSNRGKLRRYLSKIYRKYINPLSFSIKNEYKNFEKLLNKENVHIITISDYIKYAILYFFGYAVNDIKVFYPPLKKIPDINFSTYIPSNKKLLECKEKKYFMLINIERKNKNVILFLEQWSRFCEITNYKYYALLIGKARVTGNNIIQIDELNNTDLEYAYKNSFAFVYPSISEGFGYPPVEAMKYGTPIIYSNATSIPEICQQAGISFNPYYPEDLFMGLLKMVDNRDFFVNKSLMQYSKIAKKQNDDLDLLINFIEK